MQATADSSAVLGLDAIGISVEASIVTGLPAFVIVGLPDAAVQESRERVRSGIASTGLEFPLNRITVNLAPADVRKEGPSFDLPIALAILAASRQIPPESLTEWSAVGELSLSGGLRRVRGALPIAVAAAGRGMRGVIVPDGNAAEAVLVEAAEVVPARDLAEVVAFLRGQEGARPVSRDTTRTSGSEWGTDTDYDEVKGQEHAKRALEVAAAGGHNVLMIGPPGSGKTMLARRMPTILPMLDLGEAIEVTKIYSISGMLGAGVGLVSRRPFRAPHHTISRTGLVGGGAHPRPGEISLSHHGVLFLDELPEFGRAALQVLRQPLEDGAVTISRARLALSYPARFTLLAAMNPCPCGHLGDSARPCRCTQSQIHGYRERIGGPLLDRLDIHVEVPRLGAGELTTARRAESSSAIRARVEKARERQRERAEEGGPAKTTCNAAMTTRQLRARCSIDSEGARFLESAVDRLGLSARAYDRVLKVARTIADLAERDKIELADLAEAMQYRCLDREWLA